jgi:N-acyl-D-amino-acid deacylase
MAIDFLIKGGFMISGASPDENPVEADIAIEGDRIKAIGRFISSGGKKTLDVKGLCVCPGFIDTHAHSEFVLLADGRAEGKIAQGVTTEINGNCGFSAAPLYGEVIEQREEELQRFGINERWNSFDEYFRILRKRGIAINFMTLVGHGNIRASVAGYGNRPLSSSEREEAIALLDNTFKKGIRGFSTGLMYPPGCYSDTAEVIDFASVTKKYGGIYTTHIRDEGDRLTESIDEVIRVIDNTDVDAHISHLKTYGRKNWSKINDVVEMINNINCGGMILTCDRYPYTASCTSLDSLLPSWVFEGGRGQELRRLREDRRKIEDDLMHRRPDWRTVMISSVISDRNKWMEGKSIHEISIELNKRSEDCFFDILLDEELRVDAIFFSMSEENLKMILKLSCTMVGSDSSSRCFDGITASGKLHPRAYGTFPRILRKYVREDGILSLSEAIYKMTGFPARRFRIKERGVIKEGFYADIVIFDPDKIKDNADYGTPFSRPDGIYYVFINGLPAVFEGKLTGILSGRII